jgi:hypothetical protein
MCDSIISQLLTSFHALPTFRAATTTILFQASIGLPLHLLPCRFQPSCTSPFQFPIICSAYLHFLRVIYTLASCSVLLQGTCGAVIDWGTVLQARRLWVWFPMGSLDFSVDLMSTRNFPGGKGWENVGALASQCCGPPRPVKGITLHFTCSSPALDGNYFCPSYVQNCQEWFTDVCSLWLRVWLVFCAL